jgi:hypothetical protein
MKEKLTLSIDKEVKKRAKRLARVSGRSISEMVEDFLDAAASKDENKFQPEPGSITESLAGSLELPEKYENMEYKEIIQQVLVEKYDK